MLHGGRKVWLYHHILCAFAELKVKYEIKTYGDKDNEEGIGGAKR